MEWGDVVGDIRLKPLPVKSSFSFYSMNDKIRVKNHGILETTSVHDTNGYVLEMRFSDDSHVMLRTGDPRITYWYSTKLKKWVPVNREVENSITNMTVEEVHVLARNMCNGAFAFHADVFMDHEIDGFELLRMDSQALEELGITDKQMQRKFLSQVQMKLDSEAIGSQSTDTMKMIKMMPDPAELFISSPEPLPGFIEQAGAFIPSCLPISPPEIERKESSDSSLSTSDLIDMLKSRMKIEEREHKARIAHLGEHNLELRGELAHVVRNLREAKEELRNANGRNAVLNSEVERLQNEQRKHKCEVQKLEFELLLKEREFQAARVRLDKELQLSKGENLSKVSDVTLQELLAQAQQSASRINVELEKRRSSPPSEFFCPILHQIMEDPVMAIDGFTYERNAILQWFSSHNTSPLTNLPLNDLSLRPNQALFSLISEFKRKHLSSFSDV